MLPAAAGTFWCGTRAAGAIFGFDGLGAGERNILLSVLTRVAQFRATQDLWAGDPAFVALLDALRRGCPEFAG
jgi:hypothetical protein